MPLRKPVPDSPPDSRGCPQADRGALVADALACDIVSGSLAAGTVLPRETELVTRFAVSRATLRGALQSLESVGLIRRVSGHGTYVRPYRHWSFLNPLLSRWLSAFAPPTPPYLRDLFLFRLGIEPAIAALAARAARGEDLAGLEQALAGMAAHAADPRPPAGERALTAFDRSDLAFHQAIYRATGNLLWAQMAQVVEPAARLVIHRSNAGAEELRESVANHTALLACIRRQEPEAAQAAALVLLRRTARDLGLPFDPGCLPSLPPRRAAETLAPVAAP